MMMVRSGLVAAGRSVRKALSLMLRTWSGRIGLPIVLLYLILTIIGPGLWHWLPNSPTEFQYSATNITGSPVQYERLNASQPRVDVTDASQFSVGDVIRIDDELMEVTDIGTNTLHVTRGYEGTDAAAHPELQQLLAPSTQFWLGTDQYGRDILSRVLTGATSLIMTATAAATLSIVLGTAVGISSGYKGGKVDEVVMRVMDGLMSFPTLLLALLVLFALGPSRVNIAATIGFVSMPTIARVVRSTTLSLKTMEFVQSARLRGESTAYIIFREILPNVMPVIGVEASVRLSYSILSVASLGFLGLGIQPPSPDWGLAISQGRRFLISAPWIVLAPMGAVASLVIGANLLSDGIRQATRMIRKEETQ
ncbi:MAG: ABC transporter permease [Dehalococcoidia bacterium]